MMGKAKRSRIIRSRNKRLKRNNILAVQAWTKAKETFHKMGAEARATAKAFNAHGVAIRKLAACVEELKEKRLIEYIETK